MRIPLIAQDKANHVVYGAAVALAAVLVACMAAAALVYLGVPHGITYLRAAIAAQVLSTGVGAWKEWVHDAARRTTNTVSARDFWATCAGGLVVALPVLAGGAL